METKDIINVAIQILINAGVFGILNAFLQGRVSKLYSQIDKKQNEEIYRIKQGFSEFSDYMESKGFESKLYNALDNTVTDIMDTNEEYIDNALASMILEGTDKSYEFFRSIKRNGYKNINLKMIKKRGIMIFRYLRSGYNTNTQDIDRIKTTIAYPALDRLELKLRKVKRGDYNGTSDDKFITIANDFISEVISGVIDIYKFPLPPVIK